MAKYSNLITPQGALKTSTTPDTSTFEGAAAFSKDIRTELFTLAITFLGEDTFYENADVRTKRLAALTARLTKDDPGFIERLIPYLRNVANLRTAPVVMAAEYCIAGGPNRRSVVNSAMARADEPAEFVGYWITRTQKKTLPGGVQRGLADAVARLYTERSALKYDSSRHGIRMGDVVNLAHPTQGNGALYSWLLDRRHHGDARNLEALPLITARARMEAVPVEERREFMKSAEYAVVASLGGITWEYLSGWIPGGMDAAAWEAVIPSMGYMALLRNLRNFDEAQPGGIGDDWAARVRDTLANPENVAKSRQFPFRFWSAYNATKSVHWAPALEAALEASTGNIPAFDGTMLVLIDVSGSMTSAGYSRRGSVRPSDVAALFGASVFAANYGRTRVAVFGDYSKEVTPKQRGSVLRNMENFRQNHGAGHGTRIASAVQAQYKGEDRIVIFTDMQTSDKGVAGRTKFLHYFDLSGYRGVPDPVGTGGTFLYGGFTDATFRHMALNEVSRTADWDAILG